MQIPENLKSWNPDMGDRIEGVIVEIRRSWKRNDPYPIAVLVRLRRDSAGVPQLTQELIAVHGAWPELRRTIGKATIGQVLVATYIGARRDGKHHHADLHEIKRPELVPPHLRRSKIKRRRSA